MFAEQQGSSGWVQATVPLNLTLWRAWLDRGRAREIRKRAQLNTAVTIASCSVLIAAAGVWSNLMAYDLAVRFAVTVGALFVMARAFRTADPILAGVFGTLAILYNPILPLFSFAGSWERAFVVGSALLFWASMYWPLRRLRHA